MAVRIEESPQPGHWQPFYDLRLPVPDTARGHQNAALHAYYAFLCDRLGAMCYEFAVQPDGRLCFRERIADSAQVGVSARTTFERLKDSFRALRLEIPVPEWSPTDAPSKTLQKWRALWRGMLDAFSVTSEWVVEAQNREFFLDASHKQSQFQKLQQWIDTVVRSDELLPAVARWYRALPKDLLECFGRVVEISIGEDVVVAVDGMPIRAQISRVLQRPNQTAGETLQITFTACDSTATIVDLQKMMRHVILQVETNGVTLLSRGRTSLAAISRPQCPPSDEIRHHSDHPDKT